MEEMIEIAEERESSSAQIRTLFHEQRRTIIEVFPKHPPFVGLLRPSFVSQRRTDGPPNIWDTSGISGNVFANPQASSSAPYPQELNSLWKKTIEEPIHMSTAEKSERPERDIRSEMPVWTVSQRFSHLQWRRLV